MPRFYCPQPLAAGAVIDLPEAVAHHARVVRLQAGAPLTLFNGEGGECHAELTGLDKRSASARVIALIDADCELPYRLTLAQALPEAAKMDWIIEKAVELGVAVVQPLSAQRSVVKLSAERAEKREKHWQAVIVSASEQCGRTRLAQLAPLQPLARHLAAADNGPRLLLTPRASTSLAQWAAATPAQAATLLVGPEGGFTEEEEAAAIAAGAIAVSMGPRILRTETAGMAALAALNALWGGM